MTRLLARLAGRGDPCWDLTAPTRRYLDALARITRTKTVTR
jgi:hypothetical protein